jgi:hypothetical protein
MMMTQRLLLLLLLFGQNKAAVSSRIGFLLLTWLNVIE